MTIQESHRHAPAADPPLHEGRRSGARVPSRTGREQIGHSESTNVLILQHDDDAPAGLVLDVLRAADLPWQTVRLDLGEPLPDPSAVALAVSLGSDASADDTRR